MRDLLYVNSQSQVLENFIADDQTCMEENVKYHAELLYNPTSPCCPFNISLAQNICNIDFSI